jgi:ParB family chromosome partitioning protein
VTAPQKPNHLPIDSIQPNPLQPRSVFEQTKLQELADSIAVNGVIEPIVVRKHAEAYQIVVGERRWRASKLAGLTEIPVVVQDIAEDKLLELALIENIQREDLNPIETAIAYDRLARELNLSETEIGHRTGKDRSTISNMIRLLRLPKEVQSLVAENKLSMGHARAILRLTSPHDQIGLAKRAAEEGLSVRQIEALTQEATPEATKPKSGPKRETPQDPNVRAAAEELERILGTRVRIVELSEKRGRIEIEYFSQEELARVYEHLTGR